MNLSIISNIFHKSRPILEQGWEYEGRRERSAPNFLAKVSKDHKHQDISLNFLRYNAFFMY